MLLPRWNWFTARNYCRKRCMDLVSFETPQEYNWVKGFMDGEHCERDGVTIGATRNNNQG